MTVGRCPCGLSCRGLRAPSITLVTAIVVGGDFYVGLGELPFARQSQTEVFDGKTSLDPHALVVCLNGKQARVDVGWWGVVGCWLTPVVGWLFVVVFVV